MEQLRTAAHIFMKGRFYGLVMGLTGAAHITVPTGHSLRALSVCVSVCLK